MATDIMAAGPLSAFAPFVQKLIAAGDFENEAEVFAEGLRLLQARVTFDAELQKGIDELDQGLGIPADEVYAKVREHIAKIERGEI